MEQVLLLDINADKIRRRVAGVCKDADKSNIL